MTTVVVYVHGLWLTGIEGTLLRHRLGATLGAETRAFSYPSVRSTLTQNALALRLYLGRLRADRLHLVAHSMGGLVVLKLFDLLAAEPGGSDSLPPGRIVLSGSPVRGSRSARRFARLAGARALLGRTADEALLRTAEPRWAGSRDLGVIAGELGAGLGRLLGPMAGPNDGTVLVEETKLPGATEHLQLRVSHSGMMFSAAVAEQTAAFLREGRFAR